MNKLILTDADGVLVNWEAAFRDWMVSQGHRVKYSDSYKLHHHFHDLPDQEIDRYVEDFCASEAIADLDPYLDAQDYVEKLYQKHGYRFRVITSIGTDPETQARRNQNLSELFGDAIESVICLEAGSAKDLILEPYRGSGLFWIEDKYENFLTGVKLGLTSILITQEYNKHQNTHRGYRAHTWQDIYRIITA